MNRFLPVFLVAGVLAEVLAVMAIRSLIKDKSPRFKSIFWTAYSLWTLLCIATLTYLLVGDEKISDPKFMSTGFFLLSLVFCNVLFKLPIALFYLLNQFIEWVSSLVNQNKEKKVNPGRRHFLTKTGMTIGSVFLGGLLYGMWKGRYQFRVINVPMKLKNLPEAFVGKTIVQLSDIHIGSFPEHTHAVAKGIEMVNNLNPDYILFTGDMVNERALEAEPWVKIIGQLKAKYGKYATLGNHDYGDYYDAWQGKPDKIEANVQYLDQLLQEMGFQLLRNENILLEQNGQTIRLIGLENWGNHGFSQYGDMNKAMQGVRDDEVQILMSHDPTQWDAQVLGKTNIQWSLAGHTHGAQMGVEIPALNIKWSPIKYVYPRWAGHYHVNGQNLYVNRGFGYIGYAGRIGIWPEITLFELQKA